MPNPIDTADQRRKIPSVDAILQHCGTLIEHWGHSRVSDAIKIHLASIRSTIATDAAPQIAVDDIVRSIDASLQLADRPTLRQMINLTGIVLHTNLGRAVLPQQAIEAVVRAASAPGNLEYNLDTGARGDRDSHVEGLICELTGAEAATVVNNNAAAVLLVLNTLAANGDVPVSRGELVEIGGSFRIPEVMERSGCTLVEIGATNRTHLKDYRQSISERTALLMKVHTSNFRVEGFTKAVSETQLAELAAEHDLPFVIDLGSGNLVDFAALGLPDEPTAATAIDNGADVITFSGDKLLGGPQCGIIAGRGDLIEKIRTNPLKRALRLDKMTLAALSEVLKLYRHPERLLKDLPTLRFLTRPLAEIEDQARKLAPLLQAYLPPDYTVTAAACNSQIGSGALPVENIASFGLVVSAADDGRLRKLLLALRGLERPVVGRLNDGSVWLDLRCLDCESIFVEQCAPLADLLG